MKTNEMTVDRTPSMTRRQFSRRQFLAGAMAVAGGGAATLLMGSVGQVSALGLLAATPQLPIPPLLPPQVQNGTKVFNLNLQQGQSAFLPGFTTATLGINGNYLGPTLRAAQGDPVMINITNHIGEATTLHWHGMHIPAAMDGGPHQVIADNTQWTAQFTVMQPAATLWYHPHMLGQTQEQVVRGLVGLFILDDNNPAGAALPHTYGVDDIPIILQDEVFNGNGQLALGGGGGRGRNNNAQTLVNGAVAPTLTTSQTQLRFRVLNASNERFYTLGFADNREFYQVATDGGLLPSAVSLTRLEIGPAERVEIVVDVTNASDFTLQSYPSRDANNGNGGGTTTLLTINPTASAAAVTLPTPLNTIERLLATDAAVTRDMVMQGNRNFFTINGQSMTMAAMDDMSSMLQVRLGDTEIWNLVNRSDDTHLFHVHDVEFQILDRSSGALAANEVGLKDTIMVRPGETARIIMRFTDFADPMTPYMFHCHILEHEDEGMMGQFVVIPANV